MHHEMLTQRALFLSIQRGTLSQQFVMHVAPPLVYVLHGIPFTGSLGSVASRGDKIRLIHA